MRSLHTSFNIHRNQWQLYHEQVSSKNQILFNVCLMEIYEHERYLDKGRFKYFVHNDCENVVSVLKPKLRSNTVEQFNIWVNWIAENCSENWTIKISMSSVYDADVKFKFDNNKDAVLFKFLFV